MVDAQNLSSWNFNPMFWLVMNGLITLYSLAMLIVVTFGDENGLGMKFVNRQYIIYDFVTTLVWCFEAAVDTFGSDRSNFLRWVILSIAIYFTGQSVYVLYLWKWKKVNVTAMFGDVFINLVCYGIAFISLFDLHRKRYNYRGLHQIDLNLDDDPT
jgi:hypothetical protein